MEEEKPKYSNARKRAITRLPLEKYVRQTPRDRLKANGLTVGNATSSAERAAAEAAKPKKKKKRGRPKKPGPKPRYRDNPTRLSPSYRQGPRWHSITIPEEAYAMLREMSKFYKTSMAQTVAAIIKPAFEQAYQESLTLARIEATKEKARAIQETSDDSEPGRRTHF